MHNEQLMARARKLPASLVAQDDETLARQAGEDPDAFAELYGRYVERIYRFLLARTGSVVDAQDLTSQTFLAALESIERYGRGSFGGWLFGIARHKLADHYRSRRADLSLGDVEWLYHAEPTPEEVADARLQLARVSRALQSLDEQQAEALSLRVFGELSAREVGQAMGKSEAAAKMLVCRGLRRLQERLDPTLEVSL